MPKEFATLKAQNPNFMQEAPTQVPAEMKIRHFIFPASRADVNITIPLCGRVGGQVITTKRINGVTCPDCVAVLKQLQDVDTYDEAYTLVGTFFPNDLYNPDETLLEERVEGVLTLRAREQLDMKRTLDTIGVPDVTKYKDQILGSRETFFYNMRFLDLIDDNGERNSATRSRLEGNLPVFGKHSTTDI